MNATHATVDHDRETLGGGMASADATTFEIDRQSGGNISNIGGDQTIYYGDTSRGARLGKIVAALGLALSLIGFGLLVPIAVTTAHRVMDAAHAGGIHGQYLHYVPAYWPAAVGLLVGGFVFRRFARIMFGR